MEETNTPINLSVVNDTLYHIWWYRVHLTTYGEGGLEYRNWVLATYGEGVEDRNWVNEWVIVL